MIIDEITDVSVPHKPPPLHGAGVILVDTCCGPPSAKTEAKVNLILEMGNIPDKDRGNGRHLSLRSWEWATFLTKIVGMGDISD